jgi:Leucine Rich repeat
VDAAFASHPTFADASLPLAAKLEALPSCAHCAACRSALHDSASAAALAVDASSAETCARVAAAATRMYNLQAIELSLPARDVATLRNAAYERLVTGLPSRARVAALHMQEVSALESAANGAEALRVALLVAPGALTRLRLSSVRAPDAGAPALLATPAVQSAFQALAPSLRVLDMSDCRVGVHLASIAGLHQLQTLVMRGTELGARGAVVLGQHLSELTELKRLELDWNYICSRGAEAVAAGLAALPQLTYLDLSNNEVDALGACALAPCLSCLTCLQHLDLSENHFGWEGADATGPSLFWMRQLTYLSMSANGAQPRRVGAGDRLYRKCDIVAASRPFAQRCAARVSSMPAATAGRPGCAAGATPGGRW